MKTPYLVNFIAIDSNDERKTISIRTSLSVKKIEDSIQSVNEIGKRALSAPLRSLRLLKSKRFQIHIVARDKEQQSLFQKNFDSDRFGNFDIIIPNHVDDEKIVSLQIDEISNPLKNTDLGKHQPLIIPNPKKMVISDFDKTLVQTAYSNPKEIIDSLRKPICDFPTIESGISIFKKYIDEGHTPFILSSSPHFYEKAIREWLQQQNLKEVGVFLKDYRRVFSFKERVLTPKDLSSHGFYKLNHLLNILLMTGIPSEISLIGDNYEADMIIYLTLAAILRKEIEPHRAWNLLRATKEFKLNFRQNSKLIGKFSLLSSMLLQSSTNPKVKIHIRNPEGRDIKIKIPFLQKQAKLINFH